MEKFNAELFLNHLRDKWKGERCPICHTGSWSVNDRIFELREFSGGSLIVGGVPIVPIIPVTCDNCGNTVLVNAIVAKALPQKKGEKDEQ